jgi:fructosamine-3-kinase
VVTGVQRAAIEAAIGRPVLNAKPMAGGCIAAVWRVQTAGGPDVVAKTVPPGGAATFEVESFMLSYLAQRTSLPVPKVISTAQDLLILELMPGLASVDESAERHAADLLADLHGHRADRFGFERDTVIGPLPQPNPWTARWTDFFADSRLRPMAAQAAARGRISSGLRDRVLGVADAARRLLREPEAPALLHGDVWSGNILTERGRVTAFLDPAIYYGHPEVELAFIILFGTFGRAFFDRYGASRLIAPGFFETRAAIYNLYPLLVHARLFSGPYPAMIERSLAGLGF